MSEFDEILLSFDVFCHSENVSLRIEKYKFYYKNMAILSKYQCEECGYEVMSESRGHYSLMSGEYYNFSCHKCKEIVSLSADELSKMGYYPQCPKCSENEELYTWNPQEGRCPKCNGKMNQMPEIIFAD